MNRKLSNTPLRAGGFDYEGHRGCRGLMPENTIPAFMKALELGVTTLEMDAVVTKDKQVIISHEPFFNHEITTKPDGSFIDENEEQNFNIYQMSFVETQRFDVGMKPHPRFPSQQKIKATKPRLEEVIDSAETYCKKNLRVQANYIHYNIETKSQPTTDNIYHPAPAEYIELIMQIVKAKKIEQRVIIQSFDIRTLQYLHQHYPNIKTAYLFEPPSNKNFEERIDELGFIPTIYSPLSTLVNDTLIKACSIKNIKVIPWTVNGITEMKRLKQLGVHGLISDYPNLFSQLQ